MSDEEIQRKRRAAAVEASLAGDAKKMHELRVMEELARSGKGYHDVELQRPHEIDPTTGKPKPDAPPPLKPAGVKLLQAEDGQEHLLPVYLHETPGGWHVEMVYVPPGDFIMGSDDGYQDERPQHLHEMNEGYFIMRFPVLWEQYWRYCEATGTQGPPLPPWAWGGDGEAGSTPNEERQNIERSWRTHRVSDMRQAAQASMGKAPAEDPRGEGLALRIPPADHIVRHRLRFHPVVNVSWDDGDKFFKWAKLRFPTEAEWEKAARSEDGRRYPWGNDEPTEDKCVWSGHKKYGGRSTAPCVVPYCPQCKVEDDALPCRPVGADSFEHIDCGSLVELRLPRVKGRSPYGAMDMSGNVWQWCADLYDGQAYQRYVDERKAREAKAAAAAGKPTGRAKGGKRKAEAPAEEADAPPRLAGEAAAFAASRPGPATTAGAASAGRWSPAGGTPSRGSTTTPSGSGARADGFTGGRVQSPDDLPGVARHPFGDGSGTASPAGPASGVSSGVAAAQAASAVFDSILRGIVLRRGGGFWYAFERMTTGKMEDMPSTIMQTTGTRGCR